MLVIVFVCPALTVNFICTESTASTLDDFGQGLVLFISGIDAIATRYHLCIVHCLLLIHFANRHLTSHDMIKIGAKFGQMTRNFTKLA